VPFPSSSGSITAAPSVSGKISSPGTIVPGSRERLQLGGAIDQVLPDRILVGPSRSPRTRRSEPDVRTGRRRVQAARAATTAASSFGGNSATSVAGACETPSKDGPQRLEDPTHLVQDVVGAATRDLGATGGEHGGPGTR
jgi:hypothetical protein